MDHPQDPPTEALSNSKIVVNYLTTHSATYAELMVLKRRGWENPEGDEFFKNQRHRADTASKKAREVFYYMMKQIARELEHKVGCIALGRPNAKILDLCMAPGGFSNEALRLNPGSQVTGITLPEKDGGHQILTDKRNKRIILGDMTMFVNEFGLDITDVPEDHPDKHLFTTSGLSAEEKFDLVFADGQILRTHHRSEYREHGEAKRLACSQLAIAFQHMNTNGTMIMLLHKVDAWPTIKLLHFLNKVSNLKLFKPAKKHASRSSFYAVAQNVDVQCDTVVAALAAWKKSWYQATFASLSSEDRVPEPENKSESEITGLLEEFGHKLVELGDPIWEIQRCALANQPYTRTP